MGFVCGAPKGARGTGVPEVPIAALPRRMGPIFDASAGHYCPIAHGLKMRVFIESEVIRWAKSPLNPSLRIPHLSLTRERPMTVLWDGLRAPRPPARPSLHRA